MTIVRFILILSAGIFVTSCGIEKKAAKSFNLGQYQSSIDLYGQMLEKNPQDGTANFFVAESYRLSNRLADAKPYYEKALEQGVNNDSIRMNYAFSLKANQEYDKARQEMNTYIAGAGNEFYKARAEEELAHLQNIDEIRSKESYYRVKALEEINSPAAEYSPVYNDGELYFTSNRLDNKIYKATGTPFTSIYKVKTQGAIVDMNTLEQLGGVINSVDVNEGSVTFSPDGKTMVYAKGNSGKKKGTADVNLYITRNRNGEWTEPRMLNINNDGYWDSSPAFSQDGRTLYFASNRPGGYGGTDLYSAKMNSRGRFYNVKNMGPDINTTGNEMFPYVSEDGALYFSSDGHPGFGALDLFVARRQNGKTTIENLGEPMNSAADDFGFFLFRADRGFFTSNREGGMGDDDIYTFVNRDPDLKILNYFLRGVTMTPGEGDELKILTRVQVRLLDANGEQLDEDITQDDGRFEFRIYENENYNLVAERQGGDEQYLITRSPYSTFGKSVRKDTLSQLVTNIYYDTTIVLERIEKDKIFVLENIYYDLDKSDIRDDAALELDKLVTILTDNPELKIELSSHTDDRNSDDYNMALSERRAQSAVRYLVSQGIDPTRLVAKGYGESKLLIQNAQTEEEHQVNRRTEFKILEIGKIKPPPTSEFDEDRFFDDEGDDSGN
ncbi:OmpA family protein [Fulvivirga sedimenti]|uniref:OmpA family protein n=1 Tax=Fulvivirga sedimenti TaxID=2879465 RepID=A0A9X1HWA4_9BACT|nr:OmpA family protein [Fulvivirga sedimenti]MCA6078565.1 OmpA family protein [Fulvivirga sedimenti]